MRFIKTFLLGALLSLSSLAQSEVVSFQVDSAGFLVGNYAYLKVEGVDVFYGLSGRGVNLAIVDPFTGAVLDNASFDTHGSYDASAELTSYINNLINGQIVLLAVRDAATRRFYEDAQLALQSLGASMGNVTTLGHRASYALIGIVGAGVGTRSDFEAFNATAGVSVSGSLQLSDAPVLVSAPLPLTAFLFAVGLLGVNVRRLRVKK